MSSLSNGAPDAAWEAIARVVDEIPNPHNRRLVLTFLEERRANGLAMSTLGIDANALRGFCLDLVDKRLDEVTKADVVAYLNNARTVRKWRNAKKDGTVTVTTRAQRLGARTLQQRKAVLRPFFKWLRGTDETPAEMKGLKTRRSDGDRIPTDALLTRDDLHALLQAHPDPQAKAKIAVLAESGLRAGEFCALNVGSVTFDEYGAILTLPKKKNAETSLKTGARRIRLFESVPYLHAWYEAHPHKDNPKAALFYSMSRRAPMARMTPNALWQFVDRAGKTAALPKEIFPHLFRHTAATERARLGWNEAQMRAFFGWAKNSDMPSVYVHLAGLDYEEAELERRGLKGRGEKGRPALAPLVCRVCKAQNLPTATFCQACRNPVSPEAEQELEERRLAEVKEAATRMFDTLFKERMAAEFDRLIASRGGMASTGGI